jgi:hypothetical protein
VVRAPPLAAHVLLPDTGGTVVDTITPETTA